MRVGCNKRDWRNGLKEIGDRMKKIWEKKNCREKSSINKSGWEEEEVETENGSKKFYQIPSSAFFEAFL